MYELIRMSYCPVCGVPAVVMPIREPKEFINDCPVGNQEGSYGIYFQGESCECRFMVVVGRHKGDLLINIVQIKEQYEVMKDVKEVS